MPEPRSRREFVKWLWRIPVFATLLGGGYGAYEAIRVHFNKRSAAVEPTFEPVSTTTIGPLSGFLNVWDELTFELPGAGQGGAALPALAVRLPGPVPGALEVQSGVGGPSAFIAAFSRVCTHQFCIVGLNRDIDAINFGFNYRTDQPAITCSCHLSVFDPMKGGSAVSGPAVLPLPRLRLELQGGQLVATGIERA